MRIIENIDTGGGEPVDHRIPPIVIGGVPVYIPSSTTTNNTTMNNANSSCGNCSAGTAVIDTSGNCRCTQPASINNMPYPVIGTGFDFIQILKDHPHATVIGAGILLYLLVTRK